MEKKSSIVDNIREQRQRFNQYYPVSHVTLIVGWSHKTQPQKFVKDATSCPLILLICKICENTYNL